MTAQLVTAPVKEVLVDAEQLNARIEELAARISADYADTTVLIVGVLKGAVFFLADLARKLSIPCELDFIAVSSYGRSTESSGVVRLIKDLDTSIEDRHVIIVEDIVDTGLTLAYLIENLKARRPASLEVCALLSKPARREVDVDCKYLGFEIPNRFVVGYGLDYAERLRNLEYIGALDEQRLGELEFAE